MSVVLVLVFSCPSIECICVLVFKDIVFIVSCLVLFTFKG